MRANSFPTDVNISAPNELKPVRELRAACLFCYGWKKIRGDDINVAHAEEHDHDAVATYVTDNNWNFAPIQIKEVVSSELNPAASIQGVVDGLLKYVDSEDLTVVIHLNKLSQFSARELDIPRLKIAALWVLASVSRDQSKWAVWGDFMRAPVQYGEFEYPV